LLERDRIRDAFQEYCGALAAWATFNVNRARGRPFIPVTDLLQTRSRLALVPGSSSRRDRPAQAPAPPPMRFARPGERPPSRFPRGGPDNVIERFDAYAARRK